MRIATKSLDEISVNAFKGSLAIIVSILVQKAVESSLPEIWLNPVAGIIEEMTKAGALFFAKESRWIAGLTIGWTFGGIELFLVIASGNWSLAHIPVLIAHGL